MMGIIKHLLHPALHIQQINILAAAPTSTSPFFNWQMAFTPLLSPSGKGMTRNWLGVKLTQVNAIISRSEPQQSVLVQVHVQEVAIWLMVLELRKESQVNAFHRLRINIDNFASTGKIEVTMMRGGDELRFHHLTYARKPDNGVPIRSSDYGTPGRYATHPTATHIRSGYDKQNVPSIYGRNTAATCRASTSCFSQ